MSKSETSSGCGKTWVETRGGIRDYMQGVHRGGGLGETSGRSEADGGTHEGDGCRTAI